MSESAAGSSNVPSLLNPETYESQHVHDVYEQIAPHFSSTRYKPWPIVASFLCSRPAGSVGLDVGCGNGKYLPVNNGDVYVVGSDRSASLVGIARRQGQSRGAGGGEGEGPSQGHGHGRSHGPGEGRSSAQGQSRGPRSQHDAVVADTLALPHADAAFDFAISIAVVHHLSTRERRRAAIAEILRCLRRRRRRRRCGDSEEGREGDETTAAGAVAAAEPAQALLYVWALEQGGSRRGWDEGDQQDVMVPWIMKGKKQQQQGDGTGTGKENEKVFQRYYHLYRKGELEDDVIAAGGLVVESGYEKDNWWAVVTRE